MSDNPSQFNGGAKTANRLTGVLIVLQTIVIVGLAYLVWSTTLGSPRLFQAINPQTVTVHRISLDQGYVEIQSTKCNLTSEDLLIGNVTYWIRDEPSYVRINSAVLPITQGISFPPGCHTRTFQNAFPDGITPGVWHIQGSNTVRASNGQTQQIGWHTEQFEIVP